MTRFRLLLASGALVLSAAGPSFAQESVAKLDPLLRRFRDQAVVASANAAARLEQAAAAVGMPADQIVLTRPQGRLETYVDVFVSMTDRTPSLIEALGGEVRVHAGSLFGASVPLSALARLEADPRVRYIQAARVVRVKNDLAMADIGVATLRSRSGSTFSGATGSGVIVGLVDTGLDLSHADFRNPDNTTRVLYLWDESNPNGPAPGVVGGQTFSRGTECTAASINAGSCAEQDFFGHGSHVLGTAAGNGAATGNGQPAFQYTGAAPNANLIVVKGSSTATGGSFPTLNIIEGIEYIFRRAAQLGRPAVVNLSLGSDFGPHDGTDAEAQAIDSLSGPARMVVVSAGNSGSNQNNVGPGSNTPAFLIHATRTLNTGDIAQFVITVPSYTPLAGAFNDVAAVTLWYDGRDSTTVTVTRPSGTSFSRRTGDPVQTNDDVQGQIYLDNASAGLAVQNGDRQVEIEFLDANQAPAPGTWRVTVQMNRRGGSGRFDAWEYFSSFGSGGAEASITSGGDNGFTVGALATSARAITVAAYTTRSNWTAQGGNFQFIVHSAVGDLTTFSSSGPTRPIRDAASRQKPDIAAPGSAIFSSLSVSASGISSALAALDGKHWILQGTSMSAPMTTGAVALLLEKNPTLTPEQARTALTTSARSDGFTGVSYATAGGNGTTASLPNASWGYGKVGVQGALSATATPTPSATIALGAAAVDTQEVLRNAAALVVARVRISVTGDSVLLDSVRLALTGTASASAIANVRVAADLDSNGAQTAGEPVVASGVTSGGAIRVVPNVGYALPPGGSWWLVMADGADSATFGQTIQLRLDTASVFGARSRSNFIRANKAGPASIVSRVLRIGGQAVLTVSPGGKSPTGRIAVGPNPALQIVVRATTLEGARLDSIRLDAVTSGVLADLVTALALYQDTAGSGVPSGTPLITVASPFASGLSATLRGLGLNVAAGGTQTLLIAATISDRLRQADSLHLSASALNGLGLLSGRPAQVTIVTSASTLGTANLLQPDEAIILSENPVRSGQIIFSYNTTPTAITLYSFVGLRVRRFTNLPANRYVWDLRGESPGVPNGMYIVVIETGTEMIRRRLMILSPAR